MPIIFKNIEKYANEEAPNDNVLKLFLESK